MREAQKQQAVEFIKLLEEAHDEIKKSIQSKDIKAAQSLLADCQNGAIELGNMIEKTEGENTKTVSIIENYCELIYELYEKLGQGEDINNKAFKTLRQYVIKIENSIKNDIPTKKEAVFLPYKASMWDSLESVWKAAQDDENCDAYVIPIPYYDKNPDGSFGDMHYEGDQYPEYVTITHYDDYDFENRKPDMIFIHNPYDNGNKVTSIHPFFYSKNLKKFTEMLVYIPYFVLVDISPDNMEAAQSISHFCIALGVINADKVIVQSEDMRQVYINLLADKFGEKTRGIWADKILGLGSPKFDKVMNTKREDLDISEEWQKIIRKGDGSFKKIIFYNTSVSALMANKQQMILKMENVFKLFYNNRDEVALLWRPHPLFKPTIESMYPHLLESYIQLENKYLEEGWGIYDDTPDLNRAIALSDAYYGDRSSVVQLYQQVGKPIMIQNVKILENI